MTHLIDRSDLELIVTEVVSRGLDRKTTVGPMTRLRQADIAGAVRAEFARREVPQSKLAEVIGRSLPTARARMKGIYAFQPSELNKVAAFLGMGIGDFLSLAEHGTRFTGEQDAMTVSPPHVEVDLWAQPPRSRRRVV